MDFFPHYNDDDESKFMNPCGEDLEVGIYQNMLEGVRMKEPDTATLLRDMENRLRQGIITTEQRDYLLSVLTHVTHFT